MMIYAPLFYNTCVRTVWCGLYIREIKNMTERTKRWTWTQLDIYGIHIIL